MHTMNVEKANQQWSRGTGLYLDTYKPSPFKATRPHFPDSYIQAPSSEVVHHISDKCLVWCMWVDGVEYSNIR